MTQKWVEQKLIAINSPKATVANSGTLKKLIVTDAKTITENAKGNSITINDNKVTIKVTKGAEVKTITFDRKNANYNMTTNGKINKIVVSKKAKIVLTGNPSGKIAVQIKAAAKDSSITSSVPVDVTAAAYGIISLKKGAEGSTVTSTDKDGTLKVTNKTTKSVKLITPDGKKTLAAGKTTPDKNEPTDNNQNEPTKAPENSNSSTPPSSGGSSSTTYYTVTYDTNGGTAIDSVQVAGGNLLTNLPTPQKNNSIFLGWYTDSAHQNKFIVGNAVYSNLTLYAKYAEIETKQQNLNDSFALVEQNSGLSFSIISTDSSISTESVKSALALNIADGSETVELVITGGNGTFLVTAQNGFTEGASYCLTLNDSRLSFKDKAR